MSLHNEMYHAAFIGDTCLICMIRFGRVHKIAYESNAVSSLGYVFFNFWDSIFLAKQVLCTLITSTIVNDRDYSEWMLGP